MPSGIYRYCTNIDPFRHCSITHTLLFFFLAANLLDSLALALSNITQVYF